jgi:hypothetical protein
MDRGSQPPEFRFKLRLDRVGGVQTIDMTPDGGMLPPERARLSWPMRIGIGAVIVALLAGLAASAAIFLWLASVLIPVAVVAALVAYAALRIQLWRRRV